jgi:hypothetical protein
LAASSGSISISRRIRLTRASIELKRAVLSNGLTGVPFRYQQGP